MSKRSVLVVEDDESTRTYLLRFLTSRGYAAEGVDSGEAAEARLATSFTPNVILLDLLLPGMSGKEVLDKWRHQDAAIPVIVLSGIGQISSVVAAMKMGASDYLVKPFEEEELELAIENVLEKQSLKNELKTLHQKLDQNGDNNDILTTNPKMLRIYEVAKQVADADVPVLILGESGVGKEVLAHSIHTLSQRRERPFVKVNCAALPNDLLESELFGYERGAFTGALSEKPGKFEMADKGCILLDEIAEMSPHLQAKLLHVLQDGEFSRLGGKRSIRVDCRILASTNRKIAEAVARGEFREDLYYRINVIQIEIPPLRERKDDIPLISNALFKKYRDRYSSTLQHLPRELMDSFMRYEWPGNVRQLENAIKRFLIMPDLDLVMTELDSPAPIAQLESITPKALMLKEISALAADQAEKEMVLRMLDETNWNRKRAAAQLGICYKSLLNKLKKWEVRQPPARPPASLMKWAS
ncbi:MAG: sigma-54-dependent Fis family transcriptional regulator [Acidobacteria bacterium]|nr:sigma-54-dependent Fis family transcriptional regulator [Acidobacteriota bacterium]